MKSTILLSGGFDPLHIGHVRMMNAAAEHGRVVVAINSDDWLMRKKGYVFMGFEERCEVVSAIKSVSDVAAVDDADNSVCEAIDRLRPTYFGNGGDRTQANTPEQALCTRHHIPIIWALGGRKKVQSSSDLIYRSQQIAGSETYVNTPWGHWAVIEKGAGYKLKKLTIYPGHRLSYQRHYRRSEIWTIVKGRPIITIDGLETPYTEGQTIHVPIGAYHRISNPTQDPVMMIEVQHGHYLEEDDIERLDDDYRRQ